MLSHPDLILNMLDYVINEPDENELDFKKCYKCKLSEIPL